MRACVSRVCSCMSATQFRFGKGGTDNETGGCHQRHSETDQSPKFKPTWNPPLLTSMCRASVIPSRHPRTWKKDAGRFKIYSTDRTQWFAGIWIHQDSALPAFVLVVGLHHMLPWITNVPNRRPIPFDPHIIIKRFCPKVQCQTFSLDQVCSINHRWIGHGMQAHYYVVPITDPGQHVNLYIWHWTFGEENGERLRPIELKHAMIIVFSIYYLA
jgi:hypothetical protein